MGFRSVVVDSLFIILFATSLTNSSSERTSQRRLHRLRYRGGRAKRQRRNTPPVLTACMGIYPDYSGPLKPEGRVSMVFRNHDSKKFVIYYHLTGLSTSCRDCGIHVHEGISCATDTGPHHWDSSRMSDPWNPEMGAVYNSYNGIAWRHYHLNSGYNMDENEGRTITIYDQDGSQIGCGVLTRGIFNCG